MNAAFICIERNVLTHTASDQEAWDVPQASTPLISLTGDTAEEVRQKLNSYLASPEAVAHYHAQLSPMNEGETTTKEQLVCKGGHCWKWSFEILPFSESFIRKTIPRFVPPHAYMDMSMAEMRN